MRYRLITNNLLRLENFQPILYKFMQFRRPDAFVVFLSLLSMTAVCQSLKPGLTGMAPSKWLTLRTTHAPGKVYRFPGAGAKTYTNEEIYVRAWVPLLHKDKVTILLGPNYRTEQLELKSLGENPVSSMQGWNLRTFGLDLNSIVKLDTTSWLILTSHINKSGNFAVLSSSQIPFNYTFSASFLKKKSANKEIGAGLIVNKSYKLTVLPVFIFNYNFSENEGVEIMLPKKVAWRHNLSPSDILYFKAESVTRTYYINKLADALPEVCRRVDIDMGISYNRKLGHYAGFELFGGYRKNISSKLIEGAMPVKTSGLAATIELYIQPPRLNRKK
jgi:bifunctional DNA-binding transcriptional regulator/antitoxin component of YhaV-PrlF toxin-antitoxin module